MGVYWQIKFQCVGLDLWFWVPFSAWDLRDGTWVSGLTIPMGVCSGEMRFRVLNLSGVISFRMC